MNCHELCESGCSAACGCAVRQGCLWAAALLLILAVPRVAGGEGEKQQCRQHHGGNTQLVTVGLWFKVAAGICAVPGTCVERDEEP